MSPKTFISGANRGIGLGVLKRLLRLGVPKEDLFIGVRNIKQSVKDLEKEGVHLSIHNLFRFDLEDQSAIQELVSHFQNQGYKVSIIFN